MWSIALESLEIFKAAQKWLQKQAPFKEHSTPTGALVLESLDKESRYPHYFLLSDEATLSRHTIAWTYKNLHPTAPINLGISDRCNPEVEDEIFIPKQCLRSAGRTDLGGGPILFEELGFDADLQKQLANLLSKEEARGQIFGSDRALKKESEIQWVWPNLGCESWDDSSPLLLLAGKRLNLQVGCVRVLKQNSANAEKQLLEIIQQIKVPEKDSSF